MKPKTLLLYLVSLLFLLRPTTATSQATAEVTCFGKDYTRTKSKPVTTTDRFYSAHEGTAIIKLTTNGLVTGAKVTLNGQILLLHSALSEGESDRFIDGNHTGTQRDSITPWKSSILTRLRQKVACDSCRPEGGHGVLSGNHIIHVGASS